MNATTENPSAGDESPSAGDEDATGLLTPAEVAKMFHVDPKTVTRWAQAGKLTYMRTLGGHRRYRRGEVVELLRDSSKDV
ncbi:MAG: BldC family transcriptional regulator [Brachybacterium sp.]|nr:BldC family transcriptional regulator [Brachybacterium sp.]MDN5901364.1 BldC family transcriptional regulator [Brachybacterium sp.]